MAANLTGEDFSRPDEPRANFAPPRAAPSAPDRAEVIQLLRRSPLGQGLDSSELDEIARRLRFRFAPGGTVLQRQDEPGDRLFLIARGRVRIAIERADYRFSDHLGRGAHFGELAMLTEGVNLGSAVAATDCELLELTPLDFQHLLGRAPRLSVNLSRTLSQRMRWVTSGRRPRARSSVVALVHPSARTQGLMYPLARELCARGDSVEVLTDRAEIWPTGGRFLVERLPAGGSPGSIELAVRQRINRAHEHHGRILLDVTQRGLLTSLRGLLPHCEEVFWVFDPEFVDTSNRMLGELLDLEPGSEQRTRGVWVLRPGEKIAPPQRWDDRLTLESFKIVLDEGPHDLTWPERRSVLRLVRHLLGVQIGLALSGGGARGMAHLGVLRALDRAQIGFDRLATTSSGALTGMSYAAGWDADDALAEFSKNLSTPRWLRRIPWAGHAYLWANFRFNRWDPLLRPYLGQAMLEQMQVPISVMTVDLVTGQLVVRERGDAIHAILESINLPIIARPILREGQVLVDGGVLNNLPADVLVERGADLIVGVDVMSRLPIRFARNRPGMTTAEMRRPGLAETVLRINEIQDHSFSAARAALIDVMITPDTPRFDFTDFSRAAELADVGQAAAEEQIPRIRERMAELEKVEPERGGRGA